MKRMLHVGEDDSAKSSHVALLALLILWDESPNLNFEKGPDFDS